MVFIYLFIFVSAKEKGSGEYGYFPWFVGGVT